MPRRWTRDELLIAMNLYCRLPFGQFDKGNKTIQSVASKMDRTPASLSMKLCNLASLDPYHQERGVVGLKGASRLDRQVWDEFHANWSDTAEECEAAYEELMEEPTKPQQDIPLPSGPSETLQTVKVRRLQRFFRNTVLSSYDYQCAVTGMAIQDLLIASHIVPWSEDVSRRADPSNGLCLNALYDKAFDRHLVTFDEDYRMVVSSALKKNEIPEFQRVNFVDMEGTKLRLPSRFVPDESALDIHRGRFIA